MLEKSKGIVLNYIKYKESSVIVKMFTKHFGTQSFIVNSVRSPKSKGKIALLQPLSILDLVIYHNEKSKIHRLSEYKNLVPYKSIPFHIHKSTVGIFLTEILYKTLSAEEQESPILFDFLCNSLETFDEQQEHFENFHLVFLCKLSQYFGFKSNYFQDFKNELIENSIVPSAEMLNPHETQLFDQLNNCSYLNAPKISHQERRKILNILLGIYQLHFPQLKNIQSLVVLREIMN